MAMTKRLRVSFDVKVVMSTKDCESWAKELVSLSGRFLQGEKLTGMEMELARAAAQYGPEAAFELVLKAGLVNKLKTEIAEPQAHLSQFRVEVRQ